MCTARLQVFPMRIDVRWRQSELHGSQCKPPGIGRKKQRARAAFTYTTQHGQEMSPIIENVHPAENEFIESTEKEGCKSLLICVVNKTCISLTTVAEKNPFTTKLPYEVKETNNSLTSNTPGSSLPHFNAKVKAYRAQFRGVRDISFFIFRLAKIFA